MKKNLTKKLALSRVTARSLLLATGAGPSLDTAYCTAHVGCAPTGESYCVTRCGAYTQGCVTP
jgi:hypothetical protein